MYTLTVATTTTDGTLSLYLPPNAAGVYPPNAAAGPFIIVYGEDMHLMLSALLSIGMLRCSRPDPSTTGELDRISEEPRKHYHRTIARVQPYTQ